MADIKVGFRADPSSLNGILAEIQKTVGKGLQDLSISIKEIDLGGAADKFADSLNAALGKIDFSQSLNIGDALSGTNTALTELTAQITEVKRTIDQLNTSFNDIGSRGAAGLESIISSMRELNSLVQQISSKEFSITNMMTYQAGSSSNSGIALYRDQARELLGALEQLRSAMGQIDSGVMGRIYTSLKEQFATLDNMNMSDLGKRVGNKTVAGLQAMIDEAQRYKAAMEEIIRTSQQFGSGVAMPDTAGLDQATQKIAEFEQRGKDVERAFLDAAQATAQMSGAASTVDGAQQQIAASTGTASETLSQIRTVCDEINASFEKLRENINTTFDFTKAISGITELRNEVETLASSLDTMRQSLSRAQNASIAADERATIAAQRKLLSSESSETKRAYDTLLRGGYNSAEAEQIKQQYSAWVAAIEQVNAASSAASSERIAQLQSEGAAIRQAITAEQQKAAAAQAAANAQAKAAQAAQNAEAKAAAQAQKAAENESKAKERAAQAAEQAAVREANVQKQNANLRSRITTFINNNSKAYGMFKDQIDSLMSELSQEGGVTKERLAQIATEFTNIQAAARNAGALGQTFFQKLQQGWQRFGGWALVTRSFMLVVNGIKQMINSVKELDLAMTELKKVTDLTATGYDQFYQKAANVATSIGASVSDTINATADFARLGYDVNDSLKLAEASIIYKNVGDGITDIAQSTESLISTIKAFKLEATDAMTVVDELNEVGNNFAISSTGIGDALQRSASALFGAGNSLEESIGLITAANAIVQNPESVGTAMKTLTMYLRAAKTELEESGESSEGCAESISKLREQLLQLTGVDIMLDEHTFKSTYEIIKEISEVWDQLSDATKANVTGLIAGKRNANVVQALMTNFEDAENAMQTAANATGSAFLENEKYIDSIAGKLEILKAQFEVFAQGVIGDSAVKGFVDLATGILKVANALNKVHALLPTITAGISAIMGRGLANDVTRIASQTDMLVRSGGKAVNLSAILGGSIASLSASQKELLASKLQNRGQLQLSFCAYQ